MHVPAQRWCAGRFYWWRFRWRRCFGESSNVRSSAANMTQKQSSIRENHFISGHWLDSLGITWEDGAEITSLQHKQGAVF